MRKTKYKLPFLLSAEQHETIKHRLQEFKTMRQQDDAAWFNELCFCLLTANAQAQKAIAIQKEVGKLGFLTYSQEKLAEVIKKHKHRFHNVKSSYIVKARAFYPIKQIIVSLEPEKARELLVKSIKGLGYKEASHFLRNVGYSQLAIIDRHIIRFLTRYSYINKSPKNITPRQYLELENILKKFNIPLDELDLMIWCHMTDTILK